MSATVFMSAACHHFLLPLARLPKEFQPKTGLSYPTPDQHAPAWHLECEGFCDPYHVKTLRGLEELLINALPLIDEPIGLPIGINQMFNRRSWALPTIISPRTSATLPDNAVWCDPTLNPFDFSAEGMTPVLIHVFGHMFHAWGELRTALAEGFADQLSLDKFLLQVACVYVSLV